MHPMPCVGHHHLTFTLEAAFEFGRNEQEHRRASLARHQERRPVNLPSFPQSRGGRKADGSVMNSDRTIGACSFTSAVPLGFREVIETLGGWTDGIHEPPKAVLEVAALECLACCLCSSAQ